MFVNFKTRVINIETQKVNIKDIQMLKCVENTMAGWQKKKKKDEREASLLVWLVLATKFKYRGLNFFKEGRT